MTKARIATTWLDGCSGCHMSLLDIDEQLLELADRIELVYGPLVDAREFPEEVDIVLVEGAVASEEDVAKLRLIRERSRVVVSFGDCAVTGNVPAMRNEFPIAEVLHRAYGENVSAGAGVPTESLPTLLPQVLPVHEYVEVDVFLAGCPPLVADILFVLFELLEGRMPDLAGKTRFGA